MLVTVGIIALNEEENISELFDNLNAQTYPKSKIEVVLVDSGSVDNTKKIMLEFQEEYSSVFNSIKVLDNEGRIQASGWNTVIKNAEGDVIIRVDAHAILTSNFIENNVKCIGSGEFVCGGTKINVVKGSSFESQIILEAENSMFGASVAPYRNETEKKYVSTVPHACYRKEVFEKVGLFDERLLRTEDNDMHYRIRKAGYNICFSNDIISYYQSRPTTEKAIKQKFANGEWIGITSIAKNAKMFSLYHFIPALFVLAILISGIMSVAASFIDIFAIQILLELPIIILWASYFVLLLIILLTTWKKKKDGWLAFCSTVLILLFHLAYGAGTIYGILTAKKRIKND